MIKALGKVRTFKKAIGCLVEQVRIDNLDENEYEFCVLSMENPE